MKSKDAFEEPVSECDDAIHRLYYFMDGALTEDKRVQIKKHLDACPPCLRVYDFEEELRQVIANHCQETVPEGLRERVAAAIEEEAKKSLHRSKAKERREARQEAQGNAS
ncbi:MAG: mycothiol system anti-sigma-R factor [Actinobacteria bacterium]|jgi:mycothiol system anti-sigma-R factor|nr:mycothiol system anti-sigma-R factor [Actinomycetota bacterium]MCL6095748.1 mycothiol system anti-sigma-R factor [Actinomycetota bacterium]